MDLIVQQGDKIIINSIIHKSLITHWYGWLWLYGIFFGGGIIVGALNGLLQLWMIPTALFLGGLMWLLSIGSAELTYKGQVELDLAAQIIKFHYPNTLSKWCRQQLVMQPDTIPFQEIAHIYQTSTNLSPFRGGGNHPYCLHCETIYQLCYPLIIVKDALEFNEVLAVLSKYFKITPSH